MLFTILLITSRKFFELIFHRAGLKVRRLERFGAVLLPKVSNCFFPFLKKIYLILEKGEGREKERKSNSYVWLPLACTVLGTWPATQACAPTGNWTSNPLVLRQVLNLLSHRSQGCFFLFGVIFPHCTFLGFALNTLLLLKYSIM